MSSMTIDPGRPSSPSLAAVAILACTADAEACGGQRGPRKLMREIKMNSNPTPLRKFTPLKNLALLFVLFAHALLAEGNAETRYVTFQLMTGLHGYAGPQPMPGHFALSKAQLEEFVHDVVKTIGMTGDARHKLGFTVGPLCFDMSDAETWQFIHDAFAVARENDVAVAFHIDDSIVWGHRKDLLSNPDNIETADWNQVPSTGRRADWGPKPTKFPPQMCFNSPAIVAAVKDRAALIGAEIKKEVETLKA